MGVISKLDAINHMLLMAGESMVTDLENLGGVDTGVCEGVLERTLVDFQSRGLANNKYIKKFKLDAIGDIGLGSDIISAELVSDHTNSDGFRIIGVARVVNEGDTTAKLFNVTDQTYSNWAASTEYWVELVIKVPWQAMDTPVQRAIMATAARQYQIIMQGDVEADRYLNELEIMYTTRGKCADTDDKRRTIFSSGTAKLRDIHNRSSTTDTSRFRYWRTSNG